MDKDYWNRFYAKPHSDLEGSSSFALACAEEMEAGLRLFELGCGNGRDAVFFARRGMKVTGCDQSAVSIETLSAQGQGDYDFEWPTFVCGDFSNLDDSYGPLDVVYSRFTLHAINANEASRAIEWAYRNLNSGGRLFLEARSVKSSLYGLGEPCETDAFIHDGHYRRFLRLESVLEELQGLGFSIESHTESDGLAVYKDDDPVVIRVTAQK